MTQELVAIGRIIKPHGIRGEVAVHVLSDVPGRFDPGASVFVDGREMAISTSRAHQGRLLVGFERIGDRTAAELLRGALIEAVPVDLSDSETYYAHELMGLEVIDEAGWGLGHVTSLIELPPAAGYDLLEVGRPDGTTWLLPAVDDFVEIDEGDDGADRLRLVDPPEGLLDPSRAELAHEGEADSQATRRSTPPSPRPDEGGQPPPTPGP